MARQAPADDKETLSFSAVPGDVKEILNGVAADIFEGNQSAAFRYILRDWNKLKYQAERGQKTAA